MMFGGTNWDVSRFEWISQPVDRLICFVIAREGVDVVVVEEVKLTFDLQKEEMPAICLK